MRHPRAVTRARLAAAIQDLRESAELANSARYLIDQAFAVEAEMAYADREMAHAAADLQRALGHLQAVLAAALDRAQALPGTSSTSDE
jgi:hypothetical protein